MSDLISRQAAIDTFEKELSAKYNRRELAIGFVGIKSVLENLPSAQPEQKTGKWCKEIDTSTDMLACSVCGCRVIAKEYDFAVGNLGYRYCPYCGAKMGGEENATT